MKKLYFVKTNGYDMIVSVDEDKNCRYITETEDFPDPETVTEQTAKEFLDSIEDDSSWEEDCAYDELFTADEEIVAKIEKYL